METPRRPTEEKGTIATRAAGAGPWAPLAGRDVLLLVAASAFGRLILAVGWPAGGGDTVSYEIIATNIVEHACVSLSPPASAACVPHWGGNQLPGYPAFIAAIWLVFGASDLAVLVAQSLVAAAAVVWCGVCAGRLAGSRAVALGVAAVLGLSPLGLPWSRFVLTDALSMAASTWVMAELLLAIHLGRIRVFALGAALASALFLRYDNVILALPVVLVALSVAPRRRAVVQLAAVAAIVALPVGAWWIRSVSLGLPIVPDVSTMRDGSPTPSGYVRWGNAWMLDQYEYQLWNHPIVGWRYSLIVTPPHAFIDAYEREAVGRLLAELVAQYERRPMPAHHDAEFDALADRKYALSPVRHYLVLPLRRTALMWLDPRYSSGWPVSIGPTPEESPWELAATYPLQTAIKVATALYRALLVPAAVVLALLVPHRRSRKFLWIALAYALSQTVLHGALGLIETRYLLGAIAVLEVAIAFAALDAMAQRSRAVT